MTNPQPTPAPSAKTPHDACPTETPALASAVSRRRVVHWSVDSASRANALAQENAERARQRRTRARGCEEDAELFFEDSPQAQQVAKRVCWDCPARRRCLETALAFEMKTTTSNGSYSVGTVGGVGAAARDRLVRQRRARTAAARRTVNVKDAGALTDPAASSTGAAGAAAARAGEVTPAPSPATARRASKGVSPTGPVRARRAAAATSSRTPGDDHTRGERAATAQALRGRRVA
jgi:Transcription factor WhiB